MTDSVNRLEMLYHSGVHVKRLHTIPTVAARSTAEHIYGTLCVARELCQLNGVHPCQVMLALLTHDSPEVETGDIPANVKKANAVLAVELDMMEDAFHAHFNTSVELNDLEKSIVTASDNLDFLFTCLNERRMGNRHPYLTTVYRRSSDYIKRHFNLPGVAAIYAHIAKEWGNV